MDFNLGLILYHVSHLIFKLLCQENYKVQKPKNLNPIRFQIEFNLAPHIHHFFFKFLCKINYWVQKSKSSNLIRVQFRATCPSIFLKKILWKVNYLVQKSKSTIVMNLQKNNNIYSTKITKLIVSQGARASSNDMPHEVFLPHLFSEQFNGGHKYSLISCVSCAKSFGFIIIRVRLDFLQ